MMLRYDRHLNLVGEEAFRRIRDSRVLVAGAGGLGSHVLQVLTRFGFGTIHVFDPGILDEPDLNRQIMYAQSDLGARKADTAARKLRDINPGVNVVAHTVEIVHPGSYPDVDLVMDCLDSFQGRLILEQAFFENGVPIVHGGASLFYGQVTTLIPGKTPPLSEIYGKDFMETADRAPKDIYPPTVMNVAAVQASQAIKLACGMEEDLLCNKILTIDLLTDTFATIELQTPASQ